MHSQKRASYPLIAVFQNGAPECDTYSEIMPSCLHYCSLLTSVWLYFASSLLITGIKTSQRTTKSIITVDLPRIPNWIIIREWFKLKLSAPIITLFPVGARWEISVKVSPRWPRSFHYVRKQRTVRFIIIQAYLFFLSWLKFYVTCHVMKRSRLGGTRVCNNKKIINWMIRFYGSKRSLDK